VSFPQDAERKARHFLDNWKLWTVIWGFAIVCCIVALFVVYGRVAEQQARRLATQKSANTAQVAQCYTAVRNAPAVLSILDSLDVIVSSSIISSRQAIEAQPDSPLTEVRKDAILRLEPALKNVRAFNKHVVSTTPTAKKCGSLAARLGVNPDSLSPTQ
jgi:hypothetical protein